MLKLFCDNDDYDWAEKYATAELLNSETSPGNPFIFSLFDYCSLSERMLKIFVKLGLNVKTVRKNGATLLHGCASFENYRLIPFLVKSGVDINAKTLVGGTPLGKAICGCYLEVTETLLEMGASIDISITIIEEIAGFSFVRMVRCRMAMDTLVCCLKQYNVSRDMIRLIRQFVWKTRLLECWDETESSNKKIKN